MSLVPSLLQAIVQLDGEALVMHVGDKPYVVSPTGQVDLASRGLSFDAVVGVVNQLLPLESQRALDEFGAAQFDLPTMPEFPGEHFTIVAARGGADVWIEVRRQKISEDDLVPMELFTPSAEGATPVGETPAVAVAPASVNQDDDLSVPDGSQLFREAVAPEVPAGAQAFDDDLTWQPIEEEAPPSPPAFAPAASASEGPEPPVFIPAAAASAEPELESRVETPPVVEPAPASEPAVFVPAAAAIPTSEPEPVVALPPIEPPVFIPAVAASAEPEMEPHVEAPPLVFVPPPPPPAFADVATAHQEAPMPEARVETPPVLEPAPAPEPSVFVPAAAAIPTSEPEPVVALPPIEPPVIVPAAAASSEPEPEPRVETLPPVFVPIPPAAPPPIFAPTAVARPAPEPEREHLVTPPPVFVPLPTPAPVVVPAAASSPAPEPERVVTPPPVFVPLPASAPVVPAISVHRAPEPEPRVEMPLPTFVPPPPPSPPAFAPAAAASQRPPPPVLADVATARQGTVPVFTPAAVSTQGPAPVSAPAAASSRAPEPERVVPPPPAFVPLPASAPVVVSAVSVHHAPEPEPRVEMPLPTFVPPPSPPAFNPAASASQPPPPPVFADAATARQGAAPVFAPPAAAGQPPPSQAFGAVATGRQGGPEPEPRVVLPPPVFEPAASAQPAVVLPLARNPIRPDAPPPLAEQALAGLDRLLRLAVARGASTLYLSSASRPSVRVDGDIYTLDGAPVLAPNDVESLLLTLMPERNAEALRTGLASEWICDLPDVGRVRCMSFRDHRGPGGVFRIMPSRAVTADQLGLSREIQALAIEPEGLLLVSGPRSSGKRTLMSALVDLINRTRRDHVISIESEINIVHERNGSFISQREVRGGIDDMVAAARTALREDPDILVLEELRSPALMDIALDAAGSGQLVIGGIPAHNASRAVDRIIDSYPPEHRRQVQLSLAQNLRGVVAQVLLRKTTGGRVAAREVLLNTPAVSSVLAEGRTSQLPLAIEGGRRQGMVPLNDALVGFVQSGVVDVRDAYRRASDRAGFLALLKRQGLDTSEIERYA